MTPHALLRADPSAKGTEARVQTTRRRPRLLRLVPSRLLFPTTKHVTVWKRDNLVTARRHTLLDQEEYYLLDILSASPLFPD